MRISARCSIMRFYLSRIIVHQNAFSCHKLSQKFMIAEPRRMIANFAWPVTRSHPRTNRRQILAILMNVILAFRIEISWDPRTRRRRFGLLRN